MVDLDNRDHMAGFYTNRFELTEPWRWKALNEKFGADLQQIRELMAERKPIDLAQFGSIEFVSVAVNFELCNPKKSITENWQNALARRMYC